MAARNVVGVDVGGANLKYAGIRSDEPDSAVTYDRTFPLWRRSGNLAETLIEDLKRFDNPDEIAVTMTGELADCFADREIGVRHIVRHCTQAAQAIRARSIRFYGVDAHFHRADSAIKLPDVLAAANWHALATWVADHVVPDGLLIDIGSTTTDVIPLSGGRVATDALTDFDRLVEGSLVYVGCRRTAVCALVDSLVVDGRQVPVMNEWFATIDDARIVLGLQPSCQHECDTADGMPRTREMSSNRLARMVGLDRRHFSSAAAMNVASQIIDAAQMRIDNAIKKMARVPSEMLISGHGHDVLPGSITSQASSLVDTLGASCSRCASAFAVARLSLNDS